jgi:2-oxoglutarate dehydrogenase E2 component (dihydrolipoamide succinyltransferase)
MAIELKVPEVGESITEVEVGDWRKAEGDRVERDEVLAVLETDKVSVDVIAPEAGVLTQILAPKGAAASVGQVIAYIEAGASAAARPAGPQTAGPQAAAAAPKPAPAPLKPAQAPAPAPTVPARKTGPEAASAAVPGAGYGSTASEPGTSFALDSDSKRPRDSRPPAGFARVMPSARRAMRERGLTPDEVVPTGPGGRVLKEDVLRHESARPAGARAPELAIEPDRSVLAGRHEEVVPMTPLRRRIAERLVEAQSSAALLTTFNEVDMTEVMALRKQHQDAFSQKHGIKLGFMSFFVKAAVEALKVVPQVNAEIRGTDLVFKNYYDIGVAIGGGRGLVVPVIRNAERLGFAEIEAAISGFAARAKENKIKLEELQGGTFSISNGGVYGSLLSTPIVNPPQSGILGLHAIQDRPVAHNGQVVIRPMMYVALTYDHRIVDGREAVTFLKHVKECVENPTRILLEI